MEKCSLYEFELVINSLIKQVNIKALWETHINQLILEYATVNGFLFGKCNKHCRFCRKSKVYCYLNNDFYCNGINYRLITPMIQSGNVILKLKVHLRYKYSNVIFCFVVLNEKSRRNNDIIKFNTSSIYETKCVNVIIFDIDLNFNSIKSTINNGKNAWKTRCFMGHSGVQMFIKFNNGSKVEIIE